MKYLIAILLILANGISGLAQTEVKGNVAEAISGKAIAGANVMVKDPKGKLVGFSSSDEKGNFLIKIKRTLRQRHNQCHYPWLQAIFRNHQT